MKVMIIPEDFRNDQYILRPLFDRLFKRIGAASVEVLICRDPLLGGIGEALKLERLAEIVEQNQGKIDIFILCVDRDGVVGRRQRLDQIEAEFQGNCVFFAENAWEEIETWVLAGVNLPSNWRWADVRAEVDVKERYFDRLAFLRGLVDTDGGGRRVLGAEASRRIRAIRQKCTEDFDSLARRLETAVQAI
jgi:hypothetical protein